MYKLEKTNAFDKWFKSLRDLKAKAIILLRLQRLETNEHFGDVRAVGEGVRELKIDYAKGYRVYFAQQDQKIILLLCGGDKSSQDRDIEKAVQLWKQLKK